MSPEGNPPIWARIFASVSLLGYLLAGAGLSLPAERASAHCAMTHAENTPETLQAGAACPHMSQDTEHHSHDHPHAHQPKQHPYTNHKCPICDRQQPAQQIVVCPQGCCLLHSEGGEIAAIAKFLLDPVMRVALQETRNQTPEGPPSVGPEPFRAVPERPPAVPFFV